MTTKRTRQTILSSGLAATLLIFGTVWAGETPAPEDAQAYFVNLQDGDTVTGPVTIIFGLKNMGVAPAGVEKDGTGHHHLLIDTTELMGDALNEAIISDEHHRHFGGGQTETTIDLAPGSHTLQIVLGDHNHIPHTPIVASARITITVLE